MLGLGSNRTGEMEGFSDGHARYMRWKVGECFNMTVYPASKSYIVLNLPEIWLILQMRILGIK